MLWLFSLFLSLCLCVFLLFYISFLLLSLIHSLLYHLTFFGNWFSKCTNSTICLLKRYVTVENALFYLKQTKSNSTLNIRTNAINIIPIRLLIPGCTGRFWRARFHLLSSVRLCDPFISVEVKYWTTATVLSIQN